MVSRTPPSAGFFYACHLQPNAWRTRSILAHACERHYGCHGMTPHCQGRHPTIRRSSIVWIQAGIIFAISCGATWAFMFYEAPPESRLNDSRSMTNRYCTSPSCSRCQAPSISSGWTSSISAPKSWAWAN